ncbi:polysaccharide deacetylase family protein [Olsenella profusa]|uniref:Polysaccharide deacetylase n=1 Tax=Olsenella profusa TaxID=138595 RepID=A0ABS2F481_9ACTN|nr:polysaccharide deacetylase family protein [Olsenella profusa]MBM6775633.1 polysaccharide deacetylase [Olsenella profusa]
MGKQTEGRRPSAQAQQRQARGLGIVAGILAMVLIVGVGALVALAARPGGGSAQVSPGIPTLQEDDAPPPPPEPEVPEDPRAADLALDPSRQTDWRYDGTGEKTVYLTFDDGPSDNTPRVLDVLDRYGVKATFFVTGHEPDKRGYIKDAYERGNSIGLHTMSHDYAAVYASEDAFFSDLEQVGEVVREQIGFVPYLTRFPGGASNTVSANYCPGIMSALVKDVPARGYQFYDWNVSSGDASGTNVDPQTIVANSCVEGYTNVMLLFHDSSTKDTTVDALPQIIEYYQQRGYSFAAIDRSAFVCHHGVNN